MELLLASASPRRAQLLTALGVALEIAPADVDESHVAGESPAALACRLATAKAQTLASERPTALVLAADTIVVLDGAVLGKPDDRRHALAMLARLRGREHLVHTAVAIHCDGQKSLQMATSPVLMRDYDDLEIAAYVATGDPLDKAGAYACQHPEFHPVERYGNCYANVMGLPLCHVYRLLTSWGVTPPLHPLQGCPWAVEHGGCEWSESILMADPTAWASL